MEERIRSVSNDNNLADINIHDNKDIELDSIKHPHLPYHKPKRNIAALASLCLISAVIGGLTTVAAISYIYPTNISSPTQTTNSSFTQVSNVTANETHSPVKQIAKNVGPAVVGVSNLQTSRSFSGNSSLQQTGSGSGFIINAEKGYIVTNNHVIDDAQKITVSLSDGRTLDAKLTRRTNETC